MTERGGRTTLDRVGLLQVLGPPLEIATEFEPSLATMGWGPGPSDGVADGQVLIGANYR